MWHAKHALHLLRTVEPVALRVRRSERLASVGLAFTAKDGCLWRAKSKVSEVVVCSDLKHVLRQRPSMRNKDIE